MKTVWVNGCFDILHRGHFELFNYAKSLGDRLIVGVDTDEKVTKDKGLDRPYNNIDDRIYALNSLQAVDLTYIFNSREELIQLIKQISPDILVVGSDWKGKEIVGGMYAKEIIYFNRIKNYSTTNILSYDSTT